MSRSKKSRSLKRNHSGFKTGSKERTKLESKQRKAKKKLANPRAVTRQRSVYQQHLDNSGLVEAQHVDLKTTTTKSVPVAKLLSPEKTKLKPAPIEVTESEEPQKVSLWDQLESPQNNDTF